MSQWSKHYSKKLYGIDRGLKKDFIDIDDEGFLVLKLDGKVVNLYKLMVENNLSGAYVRIPYLIRKQMDRVVEVYRKIASKYGYVSNMIPVYPMKVNSHPVVVDTLYSYTGGLKWGFNVNTLAEISFLKKYVETDPRMIVVDGVKNNNMLDELRVFKERGWLVIIDIENHRDAELLDKHRYYMVGFKVKYLTRGKGPWKESSGLESKFGVYVGELLNIVDEYPWILNATVLLHMHPGSQIYDISLMKKYFREAVNLYNELKNIGFKNLNYIDFGGGLPYPYHESRVGSLYSPNYGLEEYMDYLINTIVNNAIDQPNIVFENGRYLTAPHRIVVSKILVKKFKRRVLEHCSTHRLLDKISVVDDPDAFNELVGLFEEEVYRDRQRYLLSERLCLEDLYMSFDEMVSKKIHDFIVNKRIDPKVFWKKYGKLRKYMVKPIHRFHAVFSLFTHLPDKVIVNQYFQPIPLQRLNEKPMVLATLSDLTCDSMGEYSLFMTHLDEEIGYEDLFTSIDHKLMWIPAKTIYLKGIPLHIPRPNEDYYVAFLDTGAYQDNLSMKHNSLEGFNEVLIDIVDGELRINIVRNRYYEY